MREVVLWKPSRAGATENIALNAIRYHVNADPIPMLLLGSQSEAVENFFKDRIVLGMDAVKPNPNKPITRKVVACRMWQNGGTLTASYPESRSADKMQGYQLAIIDEASLCKAGVVDTLRNRINTYRFGHLLVLSSMDARNNCSSKEDAIWIEWNTGDKREWFINDGIGDFILKSGNQDTTWGLKWDKSAKDKDGLWNYNRVGETAHYVTPNGVIWNNADKNKAVKAGVWKPTNDKPYDTRKRSYRLDSLNLPFLQGDLGQNAIEFLKAQSQGAEKLRIYIYENRCEEWTEKQIINTESNIKLNVGKYLHQNKPSLATAYANKYSVKDKLTLLTADIHAEKNGFVYAVREWVTGGNSGLVDFGIVDNWQELKNIQLKYGCQKILVDGSYNTEEVKQTLISPAFFGQSVIAFGRDNIKELYQTKLIDPYEGSVYENRFQLPSITHNPNKLKSELYRLINKGTNKDWLLPMGIDLDGYIKQLQSEALINGKWLQQHNDNHYWDCEILQLLGAIVLGLYKFAEDEVDLFMSTDAGTPTATPQAPALIPVQVPQAIKPKRSMVSYE